MMVYGILALVAVFGLMIGSFLNVVIARASIDDSPFRGRSFCMSCREVLRWHDLIPLISCLVLRRKCRYCQQSISWQYPIVEALTAVGFVGVALLFPVSTEMVALDVLLVGVLWLMVCCVIVVGVYDALTYEILTTPLVVLGLSGVGFHFIQILQDEKGVLETATVLFASAFFASLFFFLLWWVSKGAWMGFGDVQLVFILGLILGFPHILVGLFLSFVSGAVVGLMLIAMRHKKKKDIIPFAPFLLCGSVVAFVIGEELIRFYEDIVLQLPVI